MTSRLGLFSQVRAVLFDVDGTLLDSREFFFQAFEHALTAHALPIPARADIMREVFGPPLSETYARFGDRSIIAELVEAHRAFQEANLALCTPFQGTRKVLATLKRRGFRLAAITNRSRRTSVGTLELAGLAPLLDAIVSAEDVVHPKPHPEALSLVLEQLRLSPAAAVMVGDSWIDVAAGRSAGTRTAGVVYELDGLRDSSPDIVLASLEELLSLLPD